jgi:serine/threonine protein kinase
VQLLHADETPDAVTLFFRAAGRGDLYRSLKQSRRDWGEGRLRDRVIRPLLSVLANLHALGYVHRDIK